MDAEGESAWKAALQRCVATRSHALVDLSVVLVFVDAPRVFHPVYTLVEDDGESQLPLIAVMRLHPEITALLRELSRKASADEIHALVESLVFKDRVVSTVNGSLATSSAGAALFAANAVNLEGGALLPYGETEQSASQALTMVTLAVTSDDERLGTDVDRVIVVVEHSGGYLARDYTVAIRGEEAVLPRLMRIQKHEWNSNSMAQLSLDDALEDFEMAYLEEQEINGAAREESQSLSIRVSAAFEMRDLSKSSRASTFLTDEGDMGVLSYSTKDPLPPVALLSEWGGLENVRSLMCKPPPQCASTLCFSGDTQNIPVQQSTGPRKSLALLLHLEQGIQDCHTSPPWRISTNETSTSDIMRIFKRFLHNIDQDICATGFSDDTTKNTIESTVSMALDGEQERVQNGTLRSDMDLVEKVWDFLARYADGMKLIQQLLHEFMVFLSNTRIFPPPHPDNDTQLGQLIRLRHNEIQGTAASPSFTVSVQQLLTQPVDLAAALIEAGEWKMKRDVAFALAMAGFSSQECNEFVEAMPRFDPHNRNVTHVHWKAMDRVLHLCTSGQSINLPVSFMREAVHDCLSYYVKGRERTSSGDPLILLDLQSFIPDRLRANISDPLYWNLRIGFDSDFEHRLHLCRDTFHAKTKNSTSLSKLALDDATLRSIHKKAPENLLLESEMVKFITKLEDEREMGFRNQLYHVDVPTGMARFDCMLRRLHVFP